MKAKVFLSLIVGLFITLNLSAKKPETTTFSNVEVTDEGSMKEFTTFTKDTNEPLQRSIYKYDLLGNIQEKTIYTWDMNKGWVGHQKLSYTYAGTDIDKPVSLTYIKWDKNANDWSKDVKVVHYSYDNEGNASVTTTE